MSLAQELGGVRSTWLDTRRINDALRNHNVEVITRFMRSSEDFDEFYLGCPPVNDELGRHISDAIVQNSHMTQLRFNSEHSAIPDLVAWIGSRNTLVHMTSLESVSVRAPRQGQGMSVLDCSTLFPLLLTSTSLRKFIIYFGHDNGCSDDVMSALSSYLSAASLREFGFGTHRLSEADFAALCNGVALSTVRHFTLSTDLVLELNLEIAAESLALMILESSLEEVTMRGWVYKSSESLISALKLTAPVRNMDFTFTRNWGGARKDLRINRKWKHLVIGANTPLALWPHILEKSHASRVTSHGSADIVFFILRQKPDLVPAP